jgi:hypothetical protein
VDHVDDINGTALHVASAVSVVFVSSCSMAPTQTSQALNSVTPHSCSLPSTEVLLP